MGESKTMGRLGQLKERLFMQYSPTDKSAVGFRAQALSFSLLHIPRS